MRKKSKLARRFARQRQLYKSLKEHGDDILKSEKFQGTRCHVQHGSIPVHRHCIDVATHSLLISKFLKIPVKERELIRGALLHDYFLYDWHDTNRENYQFFHGYYHPGIALRNAKADYELTKTEEEIIKKHMWPLTVFPPMCREAWIVSTADKYCSILETLKLRKGVIRSSK